MPIAWLHGRCEICINRVFYQFTSLYSLTGPETCLQGAGKICIFKALDVATTMRNDSCSASDLLYPGKFLFAGTLTRLVCDYAPRLGKQSLVMCDGSMLNCATISAVDVTSALLLPSFGNAKDAARAPSAESVAKVVIAGQTPWKFSLQCWHYVESLDTFGTDYQRRFQTVPVIEHHRQEGFNPKQASCAVITWNVSLAPRAGFTSFVEYLGNH